MYVYIRRCGWMEILIARSGQCQAHAAQWSATVTRAAGDWPIYSKTPFGLWRISTHAFLLVVWFIQHYKQAPVGTLLLTGRTMLNLVGSVSVECNNWETWNKLKVCPDPLLLSNLCECEHYLASPLVGPYLSCIDRPHYDGITQKGLCWNTAPIRERFAGFMDLVLMFGVGDKIALTNQEKSRGIRLLYPDIIMA